MRVVSVWVGLRAFLRDRSQGYRRFRVPTFHQSFNCVQHQITYRGAKASRDTKVTYGVRYDRSYVAQVRC